MAWAVLGVCFVSKAAGFAFISPDLLRERAAPGPGVDRSDVVLATFVRIQVDRGHSLVSSGPYALVRPPGCAGALLAHLALPFALGSLWAVVPAGVGTILLVARTSREDRTLRHRLVGYREYQAWVRWRLLPGVW